MTAGARIFYVLPHLDVHPFEEHRQPRVVRERRLVQLSRAAGHAADLYLLSRQPDVSRLDDEVGSWLMPSDDPQATDRFSHVSQHLLETIQQERPDLVVVKGLGYRITPWLVLNSRHRFRLALMVAGQTRDVLADQADYILAETDAQIRQHFQAADRAGRVGVLPKLVTNIAAAPPAQTRFDVVNVGRFTVNKNQMALLPLADDFRLALVGHGACWPAVQARAAQRAQPVHMPGHLDSAQTRALMADSRLMVHAAHHEGVARVVMEAFAAGVPVVASARAMPDAFAHGVQGLLVPPDQLVAAARALLADEPRRVAMARAALLFARRHCSETAVLAAVQAMHQRVLGVAPHFPNHWRARSALRTRLAAAHGRHRLYASLRACIRVLGLAGLARRLRTAAQRMAQP